MDCLHLGYVVELDLIVDGSLPGLSTLVFGSKEVAAGDALHHNGTAGGVAAAPSVSASDSNPEAGRSLATERPI